MTTTAFDALRGIDVSLLVPLTGSPTHLGHMSVANRASEALQDIGAIVKGIFFCLASEEYAQSKASTDRVNLTLKEREEILQCNIDDAKECGFFQNIQVTYYGPETRTGHTGQYDKLQKEFPAHKVLLAAGADLQARMKTHWSRRPGFLAVVVNRGEQTGTNEANCLVVSGQPELGQVSSSKIQKDANQGKEIEGMGQRAKHLFQTIVQQSKSSKILSNGAQTQVTQKPASCALM